MKFSITNTITETKTVEASSLEELKTLYPTARIEKIEDEADLKTLFASFLKTKEALQEKEEYNKNLAQRVFEKESKEFDKIYNYLLIEIVPIVNSLYYKHVLCKVADKYIYIALDGSYEWRLWVYNSVENPKPFESAGTCSNHVDEYGYMYLYDKGLGKYNGNREKSFIVRHWVEAKPSLEKALAECIKHSAEQQEAKLNEELTRLSNLI